MRCSTNHHGDGATPAAADATRTLVARLGLPRRQIRHQHTSSPAPEAHRIDSIVFLITMEVSRRFRPSAVFVELLCSGRVGVRGRPPPLSFSLSLPAPNTATTHRKTCASSPWTWTSDTTSAVLSKLVFSSPWRSAAASALVPSLLSSSAPGE